MTSDDGSRFDAWQPGADLTALRRRARLYAHIRDFFAERNVLEVETPVLGRGSATDPHLKSLTTDLQIPGCGTVTAYLQTSPEFFMKRLLAAGSGPIYQIGKAFRDGEVGRLHNPEFTLLEWYRPGFDRAQLMAEVAALVAPVLSVDPDFPLISYRDAFKRQMAIDPMQATLDELQAVLPRLGLADVADVSRMDDQEGRDFCLDLIFSHSVQPSLGEERPVFVHDFPPSQAALAQLTTDHDGIVVAARFELYYRGIELANGYQELTDAAEQHRRFSDDNRRRRRAGLAPVTIDQHFCQALAQGMPETCGVALGLDRLLLCLLEAVELDSVQGFSCRRI